MKRSLKSFFTLVVALVIYQLIAAWIWHQVGFMWSFDHNRILGYALYAVEGVLLPVWIAKMIPHESKGWRRGTLIALSFLYLKSFSIENYVWMVVSGYQAAEKDWGAGVGTIIVAGQWIITSFVLRSFVHIWEKEQESEKDTLLTSLLWTLIPQGYAANGQVSDTRNYTLRYGIYVKWLGVKNSIVVKRVAMLCKLNGLVNRHFC